MGDVCAIDITTTNIQVLVRRGGGRVDGIEGGLRPAVVEDGRVAQPEEVRETISRLLMALHASPSEFRMVLSDSACVSRLVEYPPMPHSELKRSIRVEAEHELPMNPHSAYLDWQVVRNDGKGKGVLMVGAWRDLVDDYIDALEGVGHVSIVEPRSMALARAAGFPDAVLVDLTGDRVQAVLVEEYCVTLSTTTTLFAGGAPSALRLSQAVAGLIPRPAGRRAPLPGQVVFTGELYGREDVAEGLRRQPAAHAFEVVAEWDAPQPFQRFISEGQAANVGLLLRN